MGLEAVLDRLGPLGPPLRARARRAQRGASRLRARVQSHGLVLMYHRVAEPTSDPWDMAVSPKNFAAQMDVLKQRGDCLALPEFARRIAGRNAPRRSIVITFDDGYRDNLLSAAPTLEARGLPATFFVVSGTLGAGRDFWWDALARIFLETPRLPPELRLETASGPHAWRLGAAADCTPAEIRQLRGWRANETRPSHLRQTLFLAVWDVLASHPLAEAEALCERVAAWAGVDRRGPVADHPLEPDDIGRLVRGGLIDVGGHTVSHRPLDDLAPAEAAAEIKGCRAALSDLAGREIQSFSYPFGRFAPVTPSLVREAGFACACNSRPRLAYAPADPYRIPRIVVPDLDAEAFTEFLWERVG